MELTKVINKNMEVTMTEGRIIGRCKGPIKAILPVYQEKINTLTNVAVAIDTEYEDIDMDDYKMFYDWMISKGGHPSIEEYKKAVAYYTNLNK